MEYIRGTYYPHIDGIRAFAVLSVLLYHVFPWACPGGFVGVDVFFVISGYLITKSLYKDLNAGTYSIKQFYVRRIRRIYPAYTVTILMSMLVGGLIFVGARLDTLCGTGLSSVAFAANLYLFHHSGYFDTSSHENPLLNLWSLSVEEQFYVFFPLILAGLYFFCRKWLKPGLVVLLLASLALSIFVVDIQHSVVRGFYDPLCRAWELLVGSLLAVLGGGWLSGRPWGKVLAAASLVCLFIPFYGYSDQTLFPGATAMIPVVCAYFLLAAGGSGPAKHVLEWRPIVFVGKISYSLYLFHWPVIVFARYLTAGEAPMATGLVCIGASLVLATLSWKYVEVPFRLTKWTPARYFTVAGTGFALLACISVAPRYLGDNLADDCVVEAYWDGPAVPLSIYQEPDFPACENATPQSLVALGEPVPGTAPAFLLWGDSHAMALAPGFDDLASRHSIWGVFINRKHVLLDGGTCSAYPDNARNVDLVFEWLERHPECKTVVLCNRWAVRATGIMNENDTKISYSLRNHPGTEEPCDVFREGLRDLCVRLKDMGRDVIIVSSIPEQRLVVQDKWVLAKIRGLDLHDVGIDKSEYDLRQQDVVKLFSELERDGLAKVVRVEGFFFPKEGADKRPLVEDGTCLYIDDDHVSPTGAKLLMKHLEPQWQGVGLLP